MNEKVLLVDDDPGLLTLLSNELKNGTLDVLTERTGAGALRRMREEGCSVLVMGVHLPDVSSR
ncbi:MAG: DNA-binding response regulator, partial [Planctomycetota bacterium]